MKDKNISIWLDVNLPDARPQLDEDINVGVLIIGGGITGLSVAYHLINQNLNIALVEANRIANGVTSRTTGKLTFLQEDLLSKTKKIHGINKAKLYLESQKEAINIVKNIIQKENIDCNLEMVDSFIFTNTDEKKLEKEEKILKQLGIKYEIKKRLPDKTKIKKAIYVNNTYVFHPLKYVYSLKDICLKNGINIYENTRITNIEYLNDTYYCTANNRTIKAKYIVISTHYPYFLFPFLTPLKTTIEKSYIKASEIKNTYAFSAITINKPTISIRFHNNREKHYKIYLNNSHNTCCKLNDEVNFNDLSSVDNNIKYIWSNKDIITNDYLPFIGKIKHKDHLYIATGYNTWGMTNGSIAGKIISDLILEKSNKYSDLFSPSRGINKGLILNFPISLSSSLLSFIKTKLKKRKNWYPDNIKFETRNGKNVAIYIDENKKEHVVYNLCPHLKCSLIFNNVEKTWDCPCHGSRYTIDGDVIEGPSNYDIKYQD